MEEYSAFRTHPIIKSCRKRGRDLQHFRDLLAKLQERVL